MFEIPYVKKKYRVNRFSLIIGSMFPDIMDKTLLFLQLGSGRDYFHSIFVLFLCFGILFFITKGNKSISFSFLIGTIFHLLLDLPAIPIFYPFITYDKVIVKEPIPMWMNTLLTNPVVQLTEIAGGSILIFILVHNRLYNSREFISYLKTTPGGPMKYPSATKQEVQIVED